MNPIDSNTYLDVKVVDIITPVTFLEFKGPEFPHLQYNLPDLHKDLIEIIIKTGDVQKRTTNVKALMTDWLMTDHEPFKIVGDHVENIAKYFYSQVSSLKLETFTTTCWGAIYKKGDYSEPHAHCPAFLSWVYYVKASEKSSPVRFHTGHTYQPRTGYGIIFPGWLVHEVPPEQYDDERIIVVGNIEATGPVEYPQKPKVNRTFLDVTK